MSVTQTLQGEICTKGFETILPINIVFIIIIILRAKLSANNIFKMALTSAVTSLTLAEHSVSDDAL